jgi:hypothetical protein
MTFHDSSRQTWNGPSSGSFRLRIAALVGMLIILMPAWSRAELRRVEIKTREDVLGGKAFGAAGPYERIIGTAYFSADPAKPRNKIIADLDKAPRNSQGHVEYSADIHILKPKDPSRSGVNGTSKNTWTSFLAEHTGGGQRVTGRLGVGPPSRDQEDAAISRRSSFRCRGTATNGSSFASYSSAMNPR